MINYNYNITDSVIARLSFITPLYRYYSPINFFIIEPIIKVLQNKKQLKKTLKDQKYSLAHPHRQHAQFLIKHPSQREMCHRIFEICRYMGYIFGNERMCVVALDDIVGKYKILFPFTQKCVEM